METYLMVLIAVVATGGVLLLFASVGLLVWGLWRHWVVGPSRRGAQPLTAPDSQPETVQQ